MYLSVYITFLLRNIYYVLKLFSNLFNCRKELTMKLKYLIQGTALTMLLVLCTGLTAMASTKEGRLDGVHGNAIYGWAWDSTTPDTPVEVRVTVKKEGTADMVQDSTVKAYQHRDDLSAGGKGNGQHAFVVDIDWSKLEDCAYIIEARVGDYTLPNTLRYQSGTVAPAATVAATSAGPVSGNLIPLGTFKTTAYCPCYGCSEGWGRNTSTGALATANHTIAVDPRVIPYGSRVMINGVIYTAEDRGGGVKGNHIDIYFNSHNETRQYGMRRVEVFLVK